MPINPSGHPLRLVSLGGGNMAQALLTGLLRSPCPLAELIIIEPLSGTRDILNKSVGTAAQSSGVAFSCHASVEEACHLQAPDWVLLAVKPQHARAALVEIGAAARAWLGQGALLSIAAGLPLKTLQEWIGHNQLVRSMPNTPALVGQGISGAFASPQLPAASTSQAHRLLEAVGPVIWVEDEALLDAVTALSGSGPAYVFRFIEGLCMAGTQLGLSAQQADQLARATVSGAMALLNASADSPASLREKVTSRGGTTEAALKVFEDGGLVPLIEAAIRAASDRSAALGKELGREYK